MATVRSTWTSKPPVIGGVLGSVEWSGAGKMKIPAGYLMVKNDDRFLYVALDLIGDKGNDAGTDDYFWFTIDVNGNRQISPRLDINYGVPRGKPNQLGRQYYLGPGRWTGILNEESESRVRLGFATSPNSPHKHRIWEMRLELKEIGVTLSDITKLHAVNFGVRVKSSNPSFTYDYPANFYRDFTRLHTIVLSCQADSLYPANSAGAVIGGVGLIPATAIKGGYATTEAPYIPLVKDVAFGNRMNLIGNRSTLQHLWGAGARYYKVLHKAPASSRFSAIRQSWANYRWNGLKYVIENFGPDANDSYPMVNPATDYSIDDLLLQWQSIGYPAGLHHFKVEFLRENGSTVPAPAQVLTLMVDNNHPEVTINEIMYNKKPVPPCSIVNLKKDEGVKVTMKVVDREGHLKDYELRAYYGAGSWVKIHGDNYDNHVTPAKKWQGETAITVPEGAVWIPPKTCAYQFRLWAHSRIHNGYTHIGYVEDSRHVTLVKLDAPVTVMPKLKNKFCHGFITEDTIDGDGVEPKKLG